MTLPMSMRAEFAAGAVLTRGLEGELWLYPLRSWERLQERFERLPLFDPARRRLERYLFGSAARVQPDGGGRLRIPSESALWAGLGSAATLVGVNHYVEIWAPARWTAEENATLTGSGAAAAAATLGSL